MKILGLLFLCTSINAATLDCTGVKDCLSSYSEVTKADHQLLTRVKEIEKLKLKVDGDNKELEEALTFFLNQHGLTRVKYDSDNFYVVSTRDIRYTPTNTYKAEELGMVPRTFDYVMAHINLKNIKSSGLTSSFRPFMSRYGRIIDVTNTNSVIIQDTGMNVHRLLGLISELEVKKL